MAARLRAANEVATVESITGVTTRWGVRLRFALNAPHKSRRRASLRRTPQRQQQIKRKGTLLKRFDSVQDYRGHPPQCLVTYTTCGVGGSHGTQPGGY